VAPDDQLREGFGIHGHSVLFSTQMHGPRHVLSLVGIAVFVDGGTFRRPGPST